MGDVTKMEGNKCKVELYIRKEYIYIMENKLMLNNHSKSVYIYNEMPNQILCANVIEKRVKEEEAKGNNVTRGHGYIEINGKRLIWDSVRKDLVKVTIMLGPMR